MTNELKKRIITSISLFLIVVLSIITDKILFILVLFFTIFLSFKEWKKINRPFFLNIKKNRSKYPYIQFFGLLYLIIFALSSLFLYFSVGEIFLIFVLSICIFSDIGGYIIGKTVGGKKLIKISPNKTISGSIGSFIFSLFPIFLFNFQNHVFLDFNLSIKNIVFCLLISFSCQAGDLIISYFKRLNKVKNTGSILPGHGGLLDRIDGIIFALPFCSFLIFSNFF